MHRGTRSLALGLTLALSIFFASSANAASVLVTYNINLNIGLPAFLVGTTFAGPGQVTLSFLNDTPGSHASPGAVHLVSGFANLTASFTLLGDLFTGFQNIVFQPSGAGTATTLGFSLLGSAHVASGVLHCTGATCAVAGITASVPVPLTSGIIPFSLAGTLFGFPSLGPQTFTLAGAAGTFGGQTLTATITGAEIARVHVPEPTSGAMIGLGLLLALGIGGGAARIRR